MMNTNKSPEYYKEIEQKNQAENYLSGNVKRICGP